MAQSYAPPLLVLGMHRSGTSAMTGMLMRLGGAEPADMIPANAFNERGYFEPRRIVNLNDRILAAVGQRWDSLHANPVADMTPEQREGAIDMIASEVAGVFKPTGTLVIKDPRINRLLDLWIPALKAVTGHTPRALLMLRHPVAVANSLFERNGMPRDKAMLLFLRNLLDAERGSRAIPRRIVEFEELMRAPGAVLDGVMDFAPELEPGDDALADALSLLEPSLIHHTEASPNAGRSAPFVKAQRAYSLARELVADGHAIRSQIALDDIARDLDAGADLFATLLARTESQARTQDELAARQAEALSEAEGEAGEDRPRARPLTLLGELNARIKRMQAALDELETRNVQLSQDAAHARDERIRMEQTVERTEAFIDELRERLIDAAKQERSHLLQIGKLKAELAESETARQTGVLQG